LATRPSSLPLARRIRGLVHGLALGAVLYLFLVLTFAIVLPVLWRPAWTRWVVMRMGRLVVPLALAAGAVRVRGSGLERARALEGGRGYILIANHASNLDPLALMKVLGRVDLAFVAKAETLRRPLVGHILRATGWFAVERESPIAFKRFHEQVEARRKSGWVPNLVVFPEGTRSTDGRLQPFRMGTFLLAARARLPILPVVIRGTAPLHRKNGFACYPGTVRVDILPPIEPPGKVKAAEILEVVASLQKQAEAIYQAVPDLNRAEGELPAPAALAHSPSESMS
jgi:1-acyl-sn-glycerol-3-phosphate acyltransferase